MTTCEGFQYDMAIKSQNTRTACIQQVNYSGGYFKVIYLFIYLMY